MKFNDSPVWKALLKVKEHYMAGRRVTIRSGNVARIWQDPVGEHPPLCETYPVLFSIANHPDDTITQFRGREKGDIFRRRLNPDLTSQFVGLNSIIESIAPSMEPDKIKWVLGPKEKYTTKAMYSYLERNISGCDYRWIWKAKLPTKIQIFLWQLFQDVVLIRDVMKRRNWAGDPRCSFCDCRETYLTFFSVSCR